MKCRKCGWQVTDLSGKCPNCGDDLRPSLGPILRRRLAIDESNSGRLVGAALGIIVMFLTWGGIFVKERETLLPVTSFSWNGLDLLQSPDTVVLLGTALFLLGTITSILESKAFIVQIAGLVMVSFSLHSFMLSRLPEAISSNPALTSYASFAIGFYLAWLSIFMVLASGIIERHVARVKMMKANLPASEDEMKNPRHWVGRRL